MIIYSVTIILYYIFLSFFVPYIVANADRLGISPTQVTSLTSYWTAFQAQYLLYINPLTYSFLNTGEMNAIYRTTLEYVRGLKGQIKANPDVVLSFTDYKLLVIHKNLPHGTTDKSKPKEQCIVFIFNTIHLMISYAVIDIAHRHSGAMPTDADGIIPFIVALEPGAPAATYDQLIERDEVGTTEFDFPFLESEVGKIGYIAVCYVKNGVKGDMSPIVPFFII